MNKAVIKSAFAVALLAGSSMALAGPSDKVVYGNTLNLGIFGTINANIGISTNNVGGELLAGLADGVRNGLPVNARGARYEQSSDVNGNTEAATATQTAKFTLSGTVDKDCSFYSGGQQTQAINLGTIGVRTGNNDNVTIAFNQNGAINANVNTSTAGCNTQNQITITKGNGASGLLNAAAIAYDTNQFTNKIPYSVKATWQGVALGAPTTGTQQTLTATTDDSFKAVQVGAWRSAFNLDVNAPVQPLGLIAGTYSDTITVELKAL
ncbi:MULTISPECIES: hypothetical protein [Sphingobium]|uniref:hypothetical protein n=1 Tax=Sphingobium sp. MI1205 TaxID=407020 RepID=UPI0007700C1C|nr:hypothetical protein [Sphingobium sp. MI1205]AMK18314.1 hypothetical protein K663_09680 [Sphingobium sp. MI1205]